MSSNALTQINRLTKEIADLKVADSREASKEAAAQSRISRAEETVHRTKSSATAQSKQREIDRIRNELARIQNKRAGLAKKTAEKMKQLSSYESQRKREEERERKKMADEQKRFMRERERHERQITSEIESRRQLMLQGAHLGPTEHATPTDPAIDFFISHASEDKESFVRRLAMSLQDAGASVWYDEYTLTVGQSLRREIERGLANSTYGIVVLSRHFFAKKWPQLELDGLFALDGRDGKRILPIWHEITKDEVLRHSPMLADRVALNTSLETVDEIATQLLGLPGTRLPRTTGRPSVD